MITSANATVMVSDFDRAVRFYTEVLRLDPGVRFGGEWAEVRAADGFTIGIHPAAHGGAKPGAPGGVSIGFQVEDLEAAMKSLTEKGVSFSGPPTDDTAVRLAFFGDPDGNPLYLSEVQRR